MEGSLGVANFRIVDLQKGYKDKKLEKLLWDLELRVIVGTICGFMSYYMFFGTLKVSA